MRSECYGKPVVDEELTVGLKKPMKRIENKASSWGSGSGCRKGLEALL